MAPMDPYPLHTLLHNTSEQVYVTKSECGRGVLRLGHKRHCSFHRSLLVHLFGGKPAVPIMKTWEALGQAQVRRRSGLLLRGSTKRQPCEVAASEESPALVTLQETLSQNYPASLSQILTLRKL